MVQVSNVKWLSKEAKEAEVYLSDVNFSLIVFSHPFNQNVGDSVKLPLYTLNAKGIYKLNNTENLLVNRKGKTFGYEISGTVLNKELNQIQIGEFVIQLDVSLPNDITSGDYVSFVCDRIDL
ncbi:hypothetical protein BLX24_23915 [Arsenicibacter rosenii]|uniref:Uncharacterized protein n=2 Tax=Arsenicibacter rosenii TaxID=1750698 RepID=A0A1S2VEQ5_9BACT|nr:hypothetical protein BLX24_23915 [Arsenicibacter rosenii]